MDPAANPFAVLSLIVAPAILTNACSVLVMSTSNRLARAVDRARELSKQLEGTDDASGAEPARRLKELASNETRAFMLLRALQSFYAGLSGFAAAALISLIGAVLAPLRMSVIVTALEVGTVVVGLFAVGALIRGAVILVRETRLAVQILGERADAVRRRLERSRQDAPKDGMP
jgi:hypothetical protein